MITFRIKSKEDSEIRLDHFLVEHLIGYTRSKIQTQIRSGNITVNDKKCKTGYALQLNDLVKVKNIELPSKAYDLIPEDLNLDILYEDDCIIAINKPANLVVHPGAGIFKGTLVNGLIYHFKKLSNINGDIRPGIIHRLDKDTSGIILAAKTNIAHVHLAKQFKERKVNKSYTAITWGNWSSLEGEIIQPIMRNKKNPTKNMIHSNGKEAKTSFRVEKQFRHCAMVSFFPKTGRTHQIRVHAKCSGNPILGDQKYGGGMSKTKGFIPEIRKFYQNKLLKFNRHALHAKKLAFYHPKNNDLINLEAPLPNEYVELVYELNSFYA